MLFENSCSNELLKILKTLQKEDLFKNHILVGGTALSLQLGHRISVDIDLFTLHDQDNEEILEYLRTQYTNIEVLNNKTNILQVTINDIKVDFVKATGKLIQEPICENDIRLCHKEDIAGMKLNTINSQTGRKRAKDYIDIAFLIEDLSLSRMFEIYKWKYDKNDVYNVKLDLLDVNRVNPYEWEKVTMLRTEILISEVPRVIKNAIEDYNLKNNCTVKKWFKFKR